MAQHSLVRLTAVLAALLLIGGLAAAIYFVFWFDTWAPVDVSAPPGVETHGFSETVFYQSDELVERARRGSIVAGALIALGLVFALPVAVNLAKRRHRQVKVDGLSHRTRGNTDRAS